MISAIIPPRPSAVSLACSVYLSKSNTRINGGPVNIARFRVSQWLDPVLLNMVPIRNQHCVVTSTSKEVRLVLISNSSGAIHTEEA